MKQLLPVSVFILSSLGTFAQNGQISIEKDPKIDQLLKVYTDVNSNSGHYQIQVGFGNYNMAKKLKDQVSIDFPNWPSKLEFESPTYRVRLGKFKTRLEADRKFMEVRKKYPKAMLLKPEEK